jgi:hypothetical protein
MWSLSLRRAGVPAFVMPELVLTSETHDDFTRLVDLFRRYTGATLGPTVA